MRKTLSIFKGIYLAGLVLLGSACADSVQVSSNYSVSLKAFYIHPDETSFNFGSNGGTKTFTVYSQDTPWQIDLSSDWLSASPSSGTTTTQVTLTAKENPRAVARNAQFTLKSATSEWSYTSNMSATSQAATAYANPENTNVNVTATGTLVTLSVNANCDYTVSSDVTWLGVNRDSESQCSLTIDENGTLYSRTGYVSFYFGNQNLAVIQVNQQMPNVVVSTNSLEFPISGRAYRLNVTSDVSWSLQTSQTFVDARTESGGTTGEPGTTEIIIEMSPNASYQERSGYVYLSLSDARWAQIPVHQEAVYLRLKDNADNYETTARENTSEIEIESNAPWITSGWPEWATPVSKSGVGDQTVKVNIQQNNTSSNRTAVISMQPDMAGSTSHSFTLRQRMFEFKQNELYLDFPTDFAETRSFHITTDADWETFSDSEWFYTSPAHGRDNAEIFVTVQKNLEPNERNGIAYTYALERMYPVNIHQASWISKYHYDPDPVSVPCSQGAKATISVNTNDQWTAKLSDNYDWVHVTGLEGGRGDGVITITFDANPSINARGVSLEITYEEGTQKSIVPIRQEGRTVKLNSSGIFFFAKGGSTTIGVTADGTYDVDIVTGADWFSIDKNNANSTFVITASENTTGAVRQGAVKVYLTNLLAGETLSYNVTVTQTTELAGFTMLDWGPDGDLNWYTGFSGTIGEWGPDEDQNWYYGFGGDLVGWEGDIDLNWYSTFTGELIGWDDDSDLNVYSSLSITVTGYREFTTWGKKESYTGGITVEGYDQDNVWNRTFDFSSLILTGFLDDENVSYPSTDTGIGGEGYNGEDENWD